VAGPPGDHLVSMRSRRRRRSTLLGSIAGIVAEPKIVDYLNASM
jgi:hypothetical protein